MTQGTGTTIHRELFLPHAPETVWRALTESTALEAWMLPNDFAARVGHRFTFQSEPNPQYGFDGKIHCEVVECTPPSRLAYSWAAGPLPPTTVSFRLQGEGSGTRVFFEHGGFDPNAPGGIRQGAEQGWTYMLGKLEQAVTAIASAR